MKITDVDATIAASADLQHGLVDRSPDVGAGLSKTQRHVRVERADCSSCDHDVFRVGGAPVTWQQRVLASCLASEGVASHRTAAMLRDLGLWPAGHRRAARSTRTGDYRSEPPPSTAASTTPISTPRRSKASRSPPFGAHCSTSARWCPKTAREVRRARALPRAHEPGCALGVHRRGRPSGTPRRATASRRCSSSGDACPRPRATSRPRWCSCSGGRGCRSR